MNGELASLVPLCLYGNEWLSTNAEAAPDLDGANSAFQFVNSFRSRCPERGLFRDRSWEGEGIAAWLQYVKGGGVGGFHCSSETAPHPTVFRATSGTRTRIAVAGRYAAMVGDRGSGSVRGLFRIERTPIAESGRSS